MNNQIAKTNKIEKIVDSDYFNSFLFENAGKTIVIKAGGSVLESDASYESFSKMAAKLKQYSINAYLVLSAKKGRTNELIDENGGAELGALLKNYDNSAIQKSEFNNPVVAANLLQGEIDSAELLSSKLKEKGLEHNLIMQGSGNFPVIANSNYLNAEIMIEKSIEKSSRLSGIKGITVIPGFGAENMLGEKVLLGRNASDLIAGLIARLDSNVSSLIYIKDVAGVFDNFGKESECIIPFISAKELKDKKIGQVLDPRVLEWQCCDIIVTDMLNSGTRIMRE